MFLENLVLDAADPLRVGRFWAAALVAGLGGRELAHDWGALPWRVYQDPSGNEFCILPAP